MPKLKSFINHTSGASVVEFSFIMPVMLLVLVGLIEIIFAFALNTLIEGGLRESARYGVTGAGSQLERQTQIMNIVSRHTLGFVTEETAEIEMLIYPDFESIARFEPYDDTAPVNGQFDIGEDYDDVNGNGQWDEDMGVQGVGQGNDILLYKIKYDWPMLTSFFAGIIGEEINMEVALAVRNEPF